MPGKIVEIKGVKGKTKAEDKPVSGKVKVYLENGIKMLVRPENIKVVGFWD